MNSLRFFPFRPQNHNWSFSTWRFDVELTENAPPTLIDLSPSQAKSLLDSSTYWKKSLKLREEPFRLTKSPSGLYLIEVRGVAGFLKMGSTHIEIAPKFLNRASCGGGWRNALWRLLAYGHGIEALSDAGGRATGDDGIADVIAELFLSSLKGAAARGYPLGYVTRTTKSAFLRGRLDPSGYAKLIPITGNLDVIASQLTMDIPTNRLLKWAGAQLARNVEDSGRRRRLIQWSEQLPDVRSAQPPRELVPIPKRQHPYLTHAVEIAKLLRDDRSVGYSSGELTLPGFLWDSENLFERAMRRLIKEACHPLGFATGKPRILLASTSEAGNRQNTYTTPDITVMRGTHVSLHLDAKYKSYGDKPANDDFYQVLAAGRVSDIPIVVLLYPAPGISVATKSFTPQGAGNPCTVITARIGLEAFATRAGVRDLRQQVRSQAASWLSAS